MNKSGAGADSVGELIDQAITALTDANLGYGHGTDNPTDEAVHLVLFCLGIDPITVDEYLDRAPAKQERERVWTLIERRIRERKPAAYLTGIAWLHGLSFVADERALVPRSLLIEALYESLPEWMALMSDHPVADTWPETILDLCCGSGSIAVHAALQYPNASVIASDLSADALALCQENISRHQLDERLVTIQSDLFDGLANKKFDLVLCNPPYVNAASMAALPPEFLAEPDEALRGGPDGMDLIERILGGLANHLEDHGIVLLEIGHESDHFERRFEQLAFSYLPVTAGDQMVVVLSRDQLLERAG